MNQVASWNDGVLGILCTMTSELSDNIAINLTKESMLFDSAFTKLLSLILMSLLSALFRLQNRVSDFF